MCVCDRSFGGGRRVGVGVAEDVSGGSGKSAGLPCWPAGHLFVEHRTSGQTVNFCPPPGFQRLMVEVLTCTKKEVGKAREAIKK